MLQFLSRTKATIVVANSLHPETADYRDRIIAAGSSISVPHLSTVDTAVKAFHDQGIRQYLDEANPLAGGSIESAKVKLFYPPGRPSSLTTFNLTAANYSQANGIDPGVGNNSAYADTGVTPSIEGWTTSQFHLSFWANRVGAQACGDISAVSSYTASASLQCHYDDNGYLTSWDESSSYLSWSAIAYPSTAFYVGSRTATNLYKMFRNGTEITSGTSNDGTVPTDTVKLWRIPAFNQWSDRTCWFYAFGKNGIPDNLQSQYYTIVQTLMTGLGRV